MLENKWGENGQQTGVTTLITLRWFRVWNKSIRLCACVESSSAPGRGRILVRGPRSEEYLLMRLSCSVTGRITQSAADSWAHASITRTSPYFWGGGVSQAKSDQQMQFSTATAIWDDDDIMWKWTKWWRQPGEKDWRRDRMRPEGGATSSEASKGKYIPLLDSKAIPLWLILRNTCPPTLTLPDQRTKHLHVGDSLALIIKNLN